MDGSTNENNKEITMRSALNCFVVGMRIIIGIVMLFFGVFLLRHACLSLWMAHGLTAFPLLLLGLTVELVGGGILFPTLAGLVRKSPWPSEG
jgi:hypothetical protein